MAHAGLLLLVLGGVPYLADFENMAKVEAAIGASPDAVRRLGALGVVIAEDAERLWQRLRLTNNEHERLASMAEGWRRISPAFGENAAKALLYRLGPQHFTDHALLGWARSQATAHDTKWHELATLAAAVDRPGVSAEGGGLHEARHRARAGTWAQRLPRPSGMDRGGIYARAARAAMTIAGAAAKSAPVMNVLSGFADISVWQLVPVAAVALFASIIGGVSGYGTGALMPLVLVPLVGAEPVVPIIAISALFTNSSRVFAFLKYADWRRAAIVLVSVGADLRARRLGLYAAFQRRRRAGDRRHADPERAAAAAAAPSRRQGRRYAGLAFGSLGYGVVVGGTAGSGVILLSLLMAAGVEGAGVIATDAAISIVIGIVKISVFGLAGVITAQVIAFALLIGVVALPGAFLAKAFVERMPVHVHTAILDAVVLLGGAFLVYGAFR